MEMDARNQEYVDGSIYRIRLHNFLTYADAELYPGPRLNLVIGPNGTGKSSIVCALCVGLGGSTKVLGRADKMGDFVQHEKESGFTEIELFFKKRNVVIRRNIYRDNRSTWQIDGKDVSQNKVKEMLANSRIQIDNLCQFLPQDKVGDFSRMSPVQLLKATQAAIGNGELAEQQEEIMKMERENNTGGQNVEAARSRLESKRMENLQRQRDVERIREQESRRTELANLEKKLLWVQFENQKRHVEELKAKKSQFKQRLEEAKKVQFDPLEQLRRDQTASIDALRTSKKTISQEKDSLEKSLTNIKLQIEHVESNESETRAEIQSLRDRHRELRDKLEREMQKERNLHDEFSQLPDDSGLRDELAVNQREVEECDRELYNLKSVLDDEKSKSYHLNNEIKRIESQLARLENEHFQRQKFLGHKDRDCIEAYEWIQRNKDQFQRKVWGPIALEVQVKEKLHAKYLEDTLQNYVLTSFVVECNHDYNVMIRQFNEGSKRLGVHVFTLMDARIKPFNRPYTDSQFGQLKSEFKMACYLDELIKAPDVIHQVLRDHGGIHTMLVGTQATEDMINKGNNVFAALTAMNEKAGFLTPSKKYVSAVSKYGNKATTTRTNDLREPQYLAVSSDNQELLDNLQGEKTMKLRQMQQIQDQSDSVKRKEKEMLDAKHSLLNRSKDIREQLKRRQQLEGYINETKRKIQNMKANLSQDVSEKENALGRKLKNLLSKHVNHLRGGRELVSKLSKTMCQQVEVEMKHCTVEHRVTVITRVLSDEEAKLRRLKDEYESIKSQLLHAAKQAMELKKEAERAAPWNEYEEIFQSLPDDLVELQARIANYRVTLSQFRGDMRVVEIYERVQREIEEDEIELARLESSVATLQDRINAIKDPWYTRLKEIVSQINASFGQYFKDIGCVGEVHLNEDGDISKWGIERRAQFRMTGKLKTMTAEEQSGGEKSVGTIMYLMALQNLTNCPFRVVDEINQGMDIYNERKVFSRITKSSCGSQLPQYFLITPKLITGLQYHPDTKVLVILNGPYNIHQSLWDVSEFISKRRKLR
ncbi:Structural maintenance of chromosomes protein 5 [Aphanomyces cochlioides]|nr:Structural maintenance of chromosomes protein 5 [Aphanomyces cochlioides]